MGSTEIFNQLEIAAIWFLFDFFDVIIFFTQAEDSEFGGETQSECRSSGKALWR